MGLRGPEGLEGGFVHTPIIGRKRGGLMEIGIDLDTPSPSIKPEYAQIVST